MTLNANRSGRRHRAAARPLLWRLHFFGGLLAAPIVVSLAVTGIMYAWSPQIEQVMYSEALTATTQGPAEPLSVQVDAALATHPGWEVLEVTPAAPGYPGGEATTGVTLRPPHGPDSATTTVYVDPASAAVTGQIVETQRPGEWLRSLHSSWRLGPVAEPLTELAASWVLVSLLTGLFLWWPRTRRGLRRAFSFRRPGRPRWRTAHGVVGVVLSVGLAVLVVTGLTWTNYAGTWIGLARSAFSAPTPEVSTQLPGATATGVGGAHAHHVGGFDGGGHHQDSSSVTATIDQVAAAARQAGLSGVLSFDPPQRPGHAWTVSVEDNRWPINTATLAINQHTGEVVDRVTWDDMPLMAKLTDLGIAFHQAQLFGLASQIGLTVLALGAIWLIVSGYRMWWLRRPAGKLGAPPPIGGVLRNAPIWLLISFGLLMVLLPVLGVSFVIYLIVERLVRSRRGRARKGPPSAPKQPAVS